MSGRVVAALACLAFSTTPENAAATDCGRLVISESAVQMASMGAYYRILLQSYERGRRFAPQQVQKGFRRHFEELKLQWENRGYAVLSEEELKTAAPCGPTPNS